MISLYIPMSNGSTWASRHSTALQTFAVVNAVSLANAFNRPSCTFLHGLWYGASFHLLVCHLCIFFVKGSDTVFASIFNLVVCHCVILVCAWVCMNVHVYLFMYMYMQRKPRIEPWVSLLRKILTFLFWDSLSLAWALMIWLVWLTVSPRNPPVSPPHFWYTILAFLPWTLKVDQLSLLFACQVVWLLCHLPIPIAALKMLTNNRIFIIKSRAAHRSFYEIINSSMSFECMCVPDFVTLTEKLCVDPWLWGFLGSWSTAVTSELWFSLCGLVLSGMIESNRTYFPGSLWSWSELV